MASKEKQNNQEEHKNYRFMVYCRNIAIVAKRSFILYARPLAYASEVGESFRPLMNVWFVRAMYGLSIGYVLADIGINLYENKHLNTHQLFTLGGDLFVWHSFASMILPSASIHTIVKYTSKGLKKFTHTPKAAALPSWAKLIPTIVGLGSIPFIIHPLDHLTDYAMDNTLRKMYTLPVKLHEEGGDKEKKQH